MHNQEYKTKRGLKILKKNFSKWGFNYNLFFVLKKKKRKKKVNFSFFFFLFEKKLNKRKLQGRNRNERDQINKKYDKNRVRYLKKNQLSINKNRIYAKKNLNRYKIIIKGGFF